MGSLPPPRPALGQGLSRLGLTLIGLAWLGCSEPPSVDRIVLISIDTLRADHLEPYGYARKTSPELARMAAEGVRFAHVVAPSSWTLPSHASMLTGLDPAGHGAFVFGRNSIISPAVTTVAERFRTHGFRTAGFVGGVWVSKRQGFARGFETFWDPPRKNLTFGGRIRETSNSTFEWLRKHRDERVFAFIHSYEVHIPYSAPPPFNQMFDLETTGPQRKRLGLADVSGWAEGAERKPEVLSQVEKLYDAEIRFMDEAIGAFLQRLRTSDIANRTCVVFTSDHGEEFGEHGDLYHERAKLTQELVAVPLIIWCPGRFEQGRVVNGPVGVVDITPTLLELAGLPLPEGLDGRSLVPLMRGESPDESRFIVSDSDMTVQNRTFFRSQNTAFVLSLRRNAHKLIYESGNQSRRLYDLDSDPGELKDLSRDQPEVMAEFEVPLRQAIARRRLAKPNGGVPDDPTTIDPEFLEQLRSLGYVD
jgi:arylsulfatase A-like enzyme